MGVIERLKRYEREEGLQKGRQEERARAEAERLAEKREVIRNLITKFDNLSDDSIASLAVASEELVKDVRKELNKK